MSAIRLFILSTLDRGGPMHGHEIRRVAQVDRTELWTDFKAGSVYAALQRMATEGSVAVSHNEKVGNRPERTVYEITDAGQFELAAIRDAILAATELRPDPVDLALQTAHDVALPDLRRAFEARLAAITARSIAWHAQWEAARPHITTRESLTFAHTDQRLNAEVFWCRSVLEHLDAEAAGLPVAEEHRS